MITNVNNAATGVQIANSVIMSIVQFGSFT